MVKMIIEKLTPLKSVRRYCLWCCLDQFNEVKFCPATDCALYPYRTGKGRVKLRTIRLKCLDCSGYVQPEVKNCEFDGIKDEFCPLHPYRMGKNPNRVGIGNRNAKFSEKTRTHDTIFNGEIGSNSKVLPALELNGKVAVG